MRRSRRLLGIAAAAFAALLALAAALLAALIIATLPGEGGRARLPGLSAPVVIAFAPRRVPFIRAATPDDAAEALGYLHARDRLFQMDLTRRLASGRLAALFGGRALPIDERMRTLGLAEAAAASEATLSPQARTLLAAYARGVNVWIASRGRRSAWEFLIFGKPAPWQIRDSLLWGELLAWQLSGNADVELDRLALSAILPRDKIQSLWPQPAVLPPDAAALPLPREAAQEALEKARQEAQQAARQAIADFPAAEARTASNEWAVAGPRSATGAPLLAGDPHLGFEFPGLWYLARIDTPEQSLAGATAPGAPFLVFGHNRRIAWTFTNNGAAVQDIFVFKRIGTAQYLGPHGPLPFTLRHEMIEVAGRKPVPFTIRETIDGPVVALRKHVALALRAVNLTHDNHAADGLIRLNKATSIDQAQAAAALITTPVENLLVASPKRIGLIVTGCVPRRGAGAGGWPLDGGKPSDQWTGLACGDKLPRLVAPPSNLLVNTNEPVAPPGFPVPMGPDQFDDWRSIRIRADLAQHKRLTVADFTAIEHDIVSAYADTLLPALNRITPRTELARHALALLRRWDGTMRMDLPQPLIFNAWMRTFRHLVLARNHVPLNLAGPAHMQFVQSLLTIHQAAASWCGGDCIPLLAAAADQAMAALAKQYGGNPSHWRWSGPHRAVFAHPLLSALPLIGGALSASIPVPGDGSTVDRSVPAATSWIAIQGPSYRGVYDLANPDASRFVIAPGESGDIFSPDSDNFLTPWRNGATITLPPAPANIRARLTLVPAGRSGGFAP